MKPIFKHQSEMDRLSTACPPADSRPKTQAAFRWVFEEIEERQNFLPHFFRYPRLANSFNDGQKCLAIGLSMFESVEKARSQLRLRIGVLAGQGRAVKENGIAECLLLEADGVSGTADVNGHFTFHPFENSTFETRFSIVEKLES